MRFFGLNISLQKASAPVTDMSWASSGGWFPVIREPFAGAWQRNMEERGETLLTYHAVYSCITLIASDVAKCRPKLMEQDGDTLIWREIFNNAHSPVLRKPNDYQNRIQFFESWMISKLTHGNTYVLKARDASSVVRGLYVLDPLRCKPLVAPDGSVFYQLARDDLSGVPDTITVPASEIIHDMATMRYHPLCGVPPMAPAALAATQGLNIQRGSIKLFANNSRPGGILSAPGRIDPENAKRLKETWEQNYGGNNVGKIAILGDDLKYSPMSQTPVEAQLIEQLGISGKMVCSSFNVPAYMVGVGEPPAYNNIEALNQQYYSQCVQKHFEAIELCLDEGLGLTDIIGKTYGVEFDLDDLLRMDTATRIKTYSDAVKGGLFKPNEARAKFDLDPVTGGDEVYLQQQNFSLSALAKRDAQDDPFASKAPAPAAVGAAAPEADAADTADQAAAAKVMVGWELASRFEASPLQLEMQG